MMKEICRKVVMVIMGVTVFTGVVIWGIWDWDAREVCFGGDGIIELRFRSGRVKKWRNFIDEEGNRMSFGPRIRAIEKVKRKREQWGADGECEEF